MGFCKADGNNLPCQATVMWAVYVQLRPTVSNILSARLCNFLSMKIFNKKVPFGLYRQIPLLASM